MFVLAGKSVAKMGYRFLGSGEATAKTKYSDLSTAATNCAAFGRDDAAILDLKEKSNNGKDTWRVLGVDGDAGEGEYDAATNWSAKDAGRLEDAVDELIEHLTADRGIDWA